MDDLTKDRVIHAVRDFADQVHGEQTRKYSAERYIVHPLRVMKMCNEYTQDIAVLAAALLHDVLEDTPVTENELHHFLILVMPREDADRTITLVVELTDIYIKKDFPSLKRKVRKQKEAERLSTVSAAAQTIKYADIYDNTDVTVSDPDFATIYLKEARLLLEKMTEGNPTLREKVKQRVEACLTRLKANRAMAQR